jgi:alanine-glyoxylate transaminase / serine-glyoxylate transaminase / serine-pyruvate transaminase
VKKRETLRSGRHFLQVPGPTNIPGPVLQAIGQPTIDHRGPEFAQMTRTLLDGLGRLFQTQGEIVVYTASGTGAWEAALVNTLSPGDHVLAFDNGHFAQQWGALAERLGLLVEFVPGSWRRAPDPDALRARLTADRSHRIRAVLVVHNETSTGVVCRIPEIRSAIDAAGHPGLLLVDAVSALGALDYRHDEWGVDVTVSASQKGLMLPPGLAFNAISSRALSACPHARLPRSYWDWRATIEANADGMFPWTPSTNLLFGLRQALSLLEAEGLTRVFERHDRHAHAVRLAVRGWGLEVLCTNERECSSSLTAVLLPDGTDADLVREIVRERFDMSLGAGLGKLKGRVFRIGHLGDLNDLTLAGALCGVEMGLRAARVDLSGSGVLQALAHLEGASAPESLPA